MRVPPGAFFVQRAMRVARPVIAAADAANNVGSPQMHPLEYQATGARPGQQTPRERSSSGCGRHMEQRSAGGSECPVAVPLLVQATDAPRAGAHKRSGSRAPSHHLATGGLV